MTLAFTVAEIAIAVVVALAMVGFGMLAMLFYTTWKQTKKR